MRMSEKTALRMVFGTAKEEVTEGLILIYLSTAIG